MIVIDEALLAQFRGFLHCEWCGLPRHCVPHHLWARGFGGGSRLDVRVNLMSLCNDCHRAHHDGHRPFKCDLLAVVAAREKCLQDDIVAEIVRLRRAQK